MPSSVLPQTKKPPILWPSNDSTIGATKLNSSSTLPSKVVQRARMIPLGSFDMACVSVYAVRYCGTRILIFKSCVSVPASTGTWGCRFIFLKLQHPFLKMVEYLVSATSGPNSMSSTRSDSSISFKHVFSRTFRSVPAQSDSFHSGDAPPAAGVVFLSKAIRYFHENFKISQRFLLLSLVSI